MLKFIIILFTISLSGIVQAETARDIMQKVINRDDGYSQYAKQVVATCQYTINKQSLKCVEKPRIKLVEFVQRDTGHDNKDDQSVMIIQKPAAEHGIGFLQYDYDAEGKDSDQWMYLSALGKVKRIVAGNDNEPKTGTLFGSEFSYEDTERSHLNDFVYTLIKEYACQPNDCWVIESLPTPKHARKSNYSKLIQWVDKTRYMVIKAHMYDRRGRLIKQLSVSDIVEQDGIWVARKLNMNNVQTQRITTMKLNDVFINVDIDPSMLTQRTLTDGAFREKHLKHVRELR